MSIVFLSELLPKLGPFLLRLEFLANAQRQVERGLVMLGGSFVLDDGLELSQESVIVIHGMLDGVHEDVVRGSAS